MKWKQKCPLGKEAENTAEVEEGGVGDPVIGLGLPHPLFPLSPPLS